MNYKSLLLFAFLRIFSYQTLSESCEIYQFVKQEGKALANHVIKTISRAYVEACWSECVWLPQCFSINVRVLFDVIFECELNNSTKEGSPGSLVTRQESEYHDMGEVESRYCSLYECTRKQVLPDKWFVLDSSVLKLFTEKKNWTAARQYCKSLGGSGEAPPTDSYWALDGHDKDVILHGAKYKNYDGPETALYTREKTYAEVPAVPFNPEGFTIAFWVHILPLAGTNKITIYSDLQSAGDLTFRVNWIQDVKKMYFMLYAPNQDTFVQIKSGPIWRHVWAHVALTWNKTEAKVQLLRNGKVLETVTPTSFNPGSTTKISSRSHYRIGTASQANALEKFLFNGYLKHLMVFNRTLSAQEIRHVMDYTEYGPWIGLTDKTADQMFSWSDGSPIRQYVALTIYKPNTVSTSASCVAMKRNGKWINVNCDKKRPFICQKPIV